MTLQQVIQEIKKVKPFAEEEVLESPRETLGGRLSRQRTARERLKSLTETYARELVSSSAFILVSGPSASTFATLATQKYGCFMASADQFYVDLANRIPPVLYVGKNVGSNLLDVVTRHLEDKAIELGIIGYPQIIFKAEYSRTIADKADLVQLLKLILNDQLGSEIIGIQACRSSVNEAIERSHEAKITPVILLIDDADVDSAIKGLKRLTRHVARVQTMDECSAESVDLIMKNIRAQITGIPVTVEAPAAKAVIEDVVPEDQVVASSESVDDLVSQVAQEQNHQHGRKNKKNKN